MTRYRVATRILGAALAALLVLPSVTTTQPADAGKKFKTITRTFSSNSQIDIPDAGTQGPANPYPASIDVDFFKKFKKAKVKDVELTLRGFSSIDTDEVDVLLVHGGRQALVMADAGNNIDVNNLTITLDDQASEPLPNGGTLFSGTFRPGNFGGDDNFPAPAPEVNGNVNLSAFNGSKPDGQWQLFIQDDSFGVNSNGSLSDGWELRITAKVKQK